MGCVRGEVTDYPVDWELLPPHVFDELVAYYRSGAPQRTAIRTGVTLPRYCARCGNRIGVDMGDDLCADCRFWAKRQSERSGVWGECRECGRRCKRRPDGLCSKCRQKY